MNSFCSFVLHSYFPVEKARGATPPAGIIMIMIMMAVMSTKITEFATQKKTHLLSSMSTEINTIIIGKALIKQNKVTAPKQVNNWLNLSLEMRTLSLQRSKKLQTFGTKMVRDGSFLEIRKASLLI